MKNPFKKETRSYNDFDVLSDLEWHCVRCELVSGQAKTWQVWRQMGIQLDKDERGNFYKNMFCDKCKSKTVHRKLKSLKILEQTKMRSGLNKKLADKVKQIFKFEDALLLRKIPAKELEVDHKFPQVRWSKDEDINNSDMSEQEIKDKFILLSRSNNLLKSRYCERCSKIGKRGLFPGIHYWYEGSEDWDKEIDKHNKIGCIGCFWYDPYKWRLELNKIVNK